MTRRMPFSGTRSISLFCRTRRSQSQLRPPPVTLRHSDYPLVSPERNLTDLYDTEFQDQVCRPLGAS